MMFCTQCGIKITQGNQFCGACGAVAVIPVKRTVGATELPPPDPVAPVATVLPSTSISKRPTLITVLAVWQFIKAVFIFIALWGLAVFTSFAKNTTVSGFALTAVLAGLFFLSLLSAAGGVGLLKLRSYGRNILLAFACLELVLFPVGTAISIFLFWYFRKPEIKSLFAATRSVQPAAETRISRSLMIKVILGVVLVSAMILAAISMTGRFHRAPSAPFSYAPFAVVILAEDKQSVVDDFNPITERDIAGVWLATDDKGAPSVGIKFTPKGASKMEELTKANIGRRIAFSINGEVDRKHAPVIHDVVSDNASVTFNSLEEAKEFLGKLQIQRSH